MSLPTQTTQESEDSNLPARPVQPGQRDLRRLVADSELTGLCPLIPVPLLDDFARDLLRKRLVGHLATASGTAMADGEAKILACGYQPVSTSGCARGCLRLALVRSVVFLITVIFRKITRKILFFLTIKDAVETFDKNFHEGYLLRHALSLGVLRQPALAGAAPAQVDPRLLEVRGAVEAVIRQTDTRPVTNLARSVFAGSRRLVKRTAKAMARVLRRRQGAGEDEIRERLEQEGEAGLGGLIDELTRDLESQGGYLENLETSLEIGLGLRESG